MARFVPHSTVPNLDGRARMVASFLAVFAPVFAQTLRGRLNHPLQLGITTLGEPTI